MLEEELVVQVFKELEDHFFMEQMHHLPDILHTLLRRSCKGQQRLALTKRTFQSKF